MQKWNTTPSNCSFYRSNYGKCTCCKINITLLAGAFTWHATCSSFICKQSQPIARQSLEKEALFRGIMEAGAFAKIEGRKFEYYMTKRRVVLGRSKKAGDVDINIKTEGFNRYISRKHLDIVLDRNSFYALCRGKNGIFIDNSFKRHDDGRVLLPNS